MYEMCDVGETNSDVIICRMFEAALVCVYQDFLLIIKMVVLSISCTLKVTLSISQSAEPVNRFIMAVDPVN